MNQIIPTKNSKQNNLSVIGQKGESQNERALQENKASQIFQKTSIFYPLIRAHTCAYQRLRNVRFSESLAGFLFL